MSDRNINGLFEALTPNSKQKEEMLHSLLARSRDGTKRNWGYTLSKRLRPALLSAVWTICLATTAFAATHLGLDDAFMSLLNPVNQEQAEYLASGAYVVNKQVQNRDGTLHIKQVIGDSNLTYILMDFTAPEGTVLDAARYRFSGYNITAKQGSIGFKVLDDGNRSDNKISLVMSIQTINSLAGQNAQFQLKDLQAADPFPGTYTTVIPGVWETDFKLGFKEYSTSYEINKSITMFGYGAVLKTISVSPISISLKVESHSMDEIKEAAGPLKEIGVNQYLDKYPITIKYQDGTSETTNVLNGFLAIENGTHLFTIKTFENVINSKEIASIIFFDEEIPIKN